MGRREVVKALFSWLGIGIEQTGSAHRSPPPLQLSRQKYQAPVQTNEIFYGGTASLILCSTTSVVLYDIQQNSIAEVNSPPVKYVVWSADGSLVALMSKHTNSISCASHY